MSDGAPIPPARNKTREDEIQSIAKAAAREAVRETLTMLGIDASSDAAIIEAQKDFQSLRSWRKSVQAVQRQGLITAVGVVVVGVLGMIYMHFRQ